MFTVSSVSKNLSLIASIPETLAQHQKMASCNRRYLGLLIFQILILPLYFVFVRYDTEYHDVRGYEDAHVMIHIGFGFLMTFLHKYCYGAVAINWLLAALVTQWALLVQGLLKMKDMTIFLTKHLILEADIMAAAILITFGAVLGRASVGQLIFIAIVETLVGSVNLFFMETYFKVADVGGSVAIHAFGAFFGIAVSAAWIPRNKEERSDYVATHPLEHPTYQSDITSMIGSIFLYVYWPSFNAALTGNLPEYQRAICNTYIAIAACTVVSFVLSACVSHGKFEMEHIENSTLAGGVGVGSVCNMHITAGGAMIIGIIAAFISVFGYSKLKAFMVRKFHLLDTCGVMHLHGFPGVLSGLLSIFFAAIANDSVYTKEGLNSVFSATADGRSQGMQAMFQLIALVGTIVLGLVAGFITGSLAKFKHFGPVPKAEQYDDQIFWEIPA